MKKIITLLGCGLVVLLGYGLCTKLLNTGAEYYFVKVSSDLTVIHSSGLICLGLVAGLVCGLSFSLGFIPGLGMLAGLCLALGIGVPANALLDHGLGLGLLAGLIVGIPAGVIILLLRFPIGPPHKPRFCLDHYLFDD